ncbi:hypothetical protein [Mucilaginibacter sp.]|uniref:hypothetical protein n=1 Tax=Mucilaginibacter sp. TaxID=1882438 RepID=UPI00262D5B51|nr:hypothetical protein [Mucilaginibacter sp.]
MNLAYSALRITNIIQPQNEQHAPDNELMLRYQAYQATCEKFRQEIAAIQKYIPGWVPKFR